MATAPHVLGVGPPFAFPTRIQRGLPTCAQMHSRQTLADHSRRVSTSVPSTRRPVGRLRGRAAAAWRRVRNNSFFFFTTSAHRNRHTYNTSPAAVTTRLRHNGRATDFGIFVRSFRPSNGPAVAFNSCAAGAVGPTGVPRARPRRRQRPAEYARSTAPTRSCCC